MPIGHEYELNILNSLGSTNFHIEPVWIKLETHLYKTWPKGYVDNSYMTYDDPRRTMTSYGITLQFNELDPIYEDDYDELGFTNSTNTANEIGY